MSTELPGEPVGEVEREPRAIEGVATSTAAFLGETERGSLLPRLVTSYADYQRWFGGAALRDCFMPDAVRGFFENGGRRLYVCRIVGKEATTASKVFGAFVVRAAGPGAWGRRVWVRVQDGSTHNADGGRGFRLKLAYWASLPDDFQPYDPFEPDNKDLLPRPQLLEDHDDLSADPNSPSFTASPLISALVSIERTSDTSLALQQTVEQGEFLDQDGDDAAAAPDADDFEGAPPGRARNLQGLQALQLDRYRDVALVYAPYPPHCAVDIGRRVIDHCERIRSRFAVIDGDLNTEPAELDPRRTHGWDTQYAAFYAPWIETSDLESGALRMVPPGGHVLGVYARTDLDRGVFKAPANEIVRGALAVRFAIDDHMQGRLNPRGVNALRSFQGGVRVWGARTLSSDPEWRYVPVRRLLIFLEQSISEGTRWVVFEPNDERLWARVRDMIRIFLRSNWRGGALAGPTEDDAFFVRCDRTTMTQDDILNGRLICEVGVATVRPAEFVIFRVGQWTAEASPR